MAIVYGSLTIVAITGNLSNVTGAGLSQNLPIAGVGRSIFVGTNVGVVGYINVASDPRMFYSSTADGQTWTGQTQVGGGTSHGPALAAFNGRLYLAWKGLQLNR